MPIIVGTFPFLFDYNMLIKVRKIISLISLDAS